MQEERRGAGHEPPVATSPRHQPHPPVVIVVDFGLDVHAYRRQFAQLPVVVPKTCPHCNATGCLSGHGSYPRHVCDRTEAVPIRVKRLCCHLCHRTVSLLPSFCLSYRHYGTDTIQTVLSLRVAGAASWRVIGQCLLPSELPTRTTCREWVKAFSAASPHYLSHLLRQLALWQLAPGKLELVLAEVGAAPTKPQQLVRAVPHLVAWLHEQGWRLVEGSQRWLSTLWQWGSGAKLGRLV